MTITELIEIQAESVSPLPILLADGHFGLVIQWDDHRDKIGVQVYGEDNIRWIDAAQVFDKGNGALIQRDWV